MAPQPSATPSASNPNPSGISVGSQWNIGSLIGSGINSIKNTAGDVASNVAHTVGDIGHNVGEAVTGALGKGFSAIGLNTQAMDSGMQTLQDKTGPQTTVITPGYNDTGRIDAISGYPIGKWKWNQDNSAGTHANWYENANGKDEHGRPTTPATGFRLNPNKNENFNYKGMNVTINDFKPERDANGNLERDKNGKPEWDDWKPVTTIVPPKTITTQGTGANQQYQLGMQGTANGGSYQAGSSMTANNAGVTGRGNGGLTSGMWSYGGSSGGYSGGSSGRNTGTIGVAPYNVASDWVNKGLSGGGVPSK
jgi:hypothetical protein